MSFFFFFLNMNLTFIKHKCAKHFTYSISFNAITLQDWY